MIIITELYSKRRAKIKPATKGDIVAGIEVSLLIA